MLKVIKTIYLFFAVLITLHASAQKHTSSFLGNMFLINSFKINSTLEDVQKDKNTAVNLSFLEREDDNYYYVLANQQINLPGMKVLDKLSFNTPLLIFQNNKLNSVELNVPDRFISDNLNKTREQFDKEYGKSISYPEKESIYRKYIWDMGDYELIIDHHLDSAFTIHYGTKKTFIEKQWIYADRKGQGNGTIQLSLPYFEKLLESNLSVGSFEKYLPQWSSNGASNHVRYDYDLKTFKGKIPRFMITYNLRNCNITIETTDTTSKLISDYIIEEIKDIKLSNEFKKDLENFNYKIRPQRYPDSQLIQYEKKDISVSFAKDHSMIFISKIPFFKI